jgi:tetratricopeptide (TPR) repeat protein
MRNKAIWFVFVFCFFLSSTSHAQISRIEPAEPRWGQTLTIVYDTTARGAKLTPEDDIHVTARLSYPGRAETAWARMVRQGGQFKCEWRIKESLSAIAVHFVTPGGGWDDAAYTTAAIHRADGKPARGAFESRINSQQRREHFDKEIALYPDNYSAYRTQWARLALLDGDGVQRTVKHDLELHGRAGAENAELLGALSTGHLMLGREEKSRESIRRAFEKFPNDVFTAQAISDYERLVVEYDLPKVGLAEIARFKKAIVARNPKTEFAHAASTAMAEDRKATPEMAMLIETISRSWIDAEPENPLPWFNLALALQNQYREPDRAARSIEKAIELLRGGRLRLYGDVNGKQTERLTLNSYLIKGEIASRQGRNDAALAALATAKSLSPENDGRAYLIEGRILRSMNQNDVATASFLEARRRGAREADEPLKAIYQEKRGALVGFDEFVVGKGEASAAGERWKLPAPQFKASSLDGKTFDLKSLRGRIVVLNMWYIGCGPCRKEIPALNEIAREFKDKGVVFLAPTPDLPDALKHFLKTMPFDYNIVAEADDVLDLFNVATFPTHIVIDRDGQVEAMLAGAAARRTEEVRRVLLKITGARVEQR